MRHIVGRTYRSKRNGILGPWRMSGLELTVASSTTATCLAAGGCVGDAEERRAGGVNGTE